MDGVPQLRPWLSSFGWQMWLHTGWSPECLGCLVPLSTASSRVTEEVMAIRHKVIHLLIPEDLEAVSCVFAGLSEKQLEQTMAAIYRSSHRDPGGQCYRDRKLFPSIILQAVCDHQDCFIDTHVSWPGSVHDSRVLRHSPLYRRSTHLQGTSSSQMEGTHASNIHSPLITPYNRPIQGVGTQHFNCHHSRACSIVESAFGMIKTRFRAIFLQAL